MSAPIQQPASETPASAQIAPNGAPAPSPVSPAAATPGNDGKPPIARDWERDAKKFQSEKDTLEARYRPVEEAMRKHNLDPERVRNALDEYGTLWADPKARPAIQNYFKTGELTAAQQAAQAAAEEGYVDPDIVALRSTYDAKIAELERQLGAVAQTSRSTASSQVAQTLSSFSSTFKAKYPLTPEESVAFDKKMDERFNWMVDKQPQALVNLQQDTYDDLAFSALARVTDVLSLGQRVASQTQQGIAARATDARLRAPTTGNETLPQPNNFDHTPTHTEIQNVARAAVEQLRREKGYSGPAR